MSISLQEMLGTEYLTATATNPRLGVPQVWPEGFFTISQPLSGDTAEFDQVPNTRRVAPGVNRGSPSRRLDNEAVRTKQIKCITSFTHKDIPEEIILAAKSGDGTRAARARMWIDVQVVEARRRHNNLRVSSISSLLRHGIIYLDSTGNILPNSTSAYQTIDENVPANNKDQLNGIIAATWPTDGTDILGHLADLQVEAVKISGYPLDFASFGQLVPEYLRSNTSVGQLMQSNQMLTGDLMMNRIPKGFGLEGLTWRPLYTSYFVDADGTDREWFGGDFVVFYPTPTSDWYTMFEGTYQIPSEAVAVKAPNVGSLVGGTATGTGFSSWALELQDPPGWRLYFKDCFLPALKVPDAVFIADVAF